MEIFDYWRGLGSRRWLLLIAPVVAAGAAIGIGFAQPAGQSGVTTVQVPVSASDGPIVVRRNVADFTSLMQSDAVLQKVAGQTHVSASKINSALTVTQVSDGSTVEVQIKGAPSMKPASVSATLAQTTIDQFMAGLKNGTNSRLTQAQGVVTTAQQNATAAQTALDTFVAAAGHPNPAEAYTATRNLVDQLNLQLATAQRRGYTDQANTLKNQVGALTPQLTTQGAAADKYNAQLSALTATRSQTQQALAAAQRTLVNIQASAQQDPPVGGVVATTSQKVSRTTALEQLGAGGAVVGFVLALVGLAIAAARRRRRNPGTRAPATVDAGPRPASAQGGPVVTDRRDDTVAVGERVDEPVRS